MFMKRKSMAWLLMNHSFLTGCPGRSAGLDEVPEGEKERLEWLGKTWRSEITPEVRKSLEKWYGAEKATNVPPMQKPSRSVNTDGGLLMRRSGNFSDAWEIGLKSIDPFPSPGPVLRLLTVWPRIPSTTSMSLILLHRAPAWAGFHGYIPPHHPSVQPAG
jgi:hypothetical protein